MDRRTFGFCCLFLMISFAAPSQAGNVLLPDDNSNSGAPNLGLTPSSSNPPAPTANTQNPAPAAPAKPAAQPNAQQPAAQQPAQTAAPAAPATSQTAQPANPQAFLPFTPTPTLKTAPGTGSNKMPTMVIELPETPDFSQIQGMNMPMSALVELSQQSTWSTTDLATLTQKLGITGSRATSACRISLNGMLITDKTPGLIDSRGTTSTVVHFDGQVRSIIIGTRALCDTGTAPPEGAGVLQKMGNLFVVPLNSALCRAPANGQVKRITITHGYGTVDECAVQ